MGGVEAEGSVKPCVEYREKTLARTHSYFYNQLSQKHAHPATKPL